MMLSKLKLFLAKVNYSKPIPGIVMPFIYLKRTSVEFNTVLIILQCRIYAVKRKDSRIKINWQMISNINSG